jgi:AbrB family looped-hinge helix DNA binding protein
MAVLTSRISSKGQVTIPKQVRETLRVEPGDTIVYDIVGTAVRSAGRSRSTPWLMLPWPEP